MKIKSEINLNCFSIKVTTIVLTEHVYEASYITCCQYFVLNPVHLITASLHLGMSDKRLLQ